MSNKIIFKFLYGIVIALGVYIPYSEIVSATTKLAPRENIFLLLVVVTGSYVFLENKELKNNVLLFSPILIFVCGVLILNTSEYLIYMGLPIIHVVVLIKTSYTYINRDFFEDSIKKIIYILLLSSILYLVVNNDMIEYLGKFYFVFLFFSVIILRRARVYQYKLKENATYKKDAIVLLSVFLLTTEKIYGLLIKFIVFLLSKLDFIIEKILYCIGDVVQLIYEWVSSIFGKFQEENYKNTSQHISFDNKKKDIINQPGDTTVLKILCILFVIFMMYKIIKFANRKKLQLYGIGVEEEEREKLEVLNKKTLFNKFKNKFSHSKSINKIILIFYNVEKNFYKKGIFNKTMTAMQLYKIGKNSIKSKDELKVVVDAYNKVKFSGHDLDEISIKKVEMAYEKLKKEF